MAKREIIQDVTIVFTDGTTEIFHNVEVVPEENYVALGKLEDGTIHFEMFPYHTITSVTGKHVEGSEK